MSCAETDPDSIACNFCEDTFESKGYLMSNKKRTHNEKVEICWNFSSGTCPYGEQNCWFSHSKERINSRLSEFNYNFCETICMSQSEMLNHRKMKHGKNVPLCKNSKMEHANMEKRNAGLIIKVKKYSKKMKMKKIM